MVMTSIEWTPALSVGVEVIDQDHKKLIDLLNGIFAACAMGVGDEVVGEAVQELRQYTLYHFEREENLLVEKGYPKCPAHREEHRKLVAQLDEMTPHLTGGESGSGGMQVMTFLRHWLIDHIMAHDLEYARFLNEGRRTT